MNTKVVIRSSLLWLSTAVLVIVTYWNILIFDKSASDLPPRNTSDVVVQEFRYEPIREILADTEYRTGMIAFITNRDLKLEKSTLQDDLRWSQAQFMLVPWVLLRDMRSVSGYSTKAATQFVIGDFWDGAPAEFPPDLVKVYESADGLILFRRTAPE